MNQFTQPYESSMTLDSTNHSYPSLQSPRSPQLIGATLHDNQSSNQGRYSAPAPPLPYAPRYSSVHTLPHRNHDSRASTSVTGYLSTSPMQDPRSPSFDYSQPPMSPLPPYIARPPPAMQPPRYYQEIHQEIQGSNQMRPMAIDDRTDGYGYESERTPGRGNVNNEDMLFRSAGQINQESDSYIMNVLIRNFEKADQERVRNLVLEGLAERWGDEFDPTYNQDVNDIHSYYVKRHHATVIVLELQGDSTLNENNSSIIGCGILLPLPAEDVYGTWCAEPLSSIRATTDSAKEPRLCRMMRLSVSSQHRGKGYAKTIIKYLVNVAKEQQFDRILVETETVWASAVQIYKSVGFQVAEAGEENVHYEYRL
ncbi:hypothetical protein BGZ49_006040 [Haplosporangium sp. Z 27]|nr:hypothetical protein BGZ49_006040 [Haplosporangium sp. Z 27]